MENYEKAYKGALERAKDCCVNKKFSELEDTAQQLCEYVFPELRESEDEKIRKMLIKLVKEHLVNHERCMAESWLEKKGEQKPIDKLKFKVKYAGSEYNVFEIKDIAGVAFYGIEDEQNHIDYVKAENCEIISGYDIKENGSPYPTKIAVFSEQKPTDEDMKEALRTEYEKGRADAFAQMQKEWSEEDEEMFRSLKKLLNEASCYSCTEGSDKILNWLKSLKPNHWKPSKEQMEELEYVTRGNSYPHLTSLYQDLKNFKL
jgi:hypothetical protein